MRPGKFSLKRKKQREFCMWLPLALVTTRSQCLGDEPFDGWLATLNPVLYPLESTSSIRKPINLLVVLLFQPTQLLRGPQNAFRKVGSVTPGLHQPEVGDHEVVWWDISALQEATQDRTSTK
jgi:hypothetical protein